jgi:outer membrane cobalamin receptor
MIRTIIIVLLAWASIAYAENNDCRWDDSIPCVTIAKAKLGNSNQLGDKITPTSIITKSEIERHGLIDLPKVLNFTQGMDVTQSGPTGQQGTIFLRGTNSNHTLVLLNGIPINDFSTPTGAFDVGPEFMFGVQQVEVYKGTAAAHWGADAIGGAVNLITAVDYENKIAVGGSGDSKTINGNYHTRHNDWDINISAGTHESQTASALAGASEKDGVENQTVGINISRWFDNINFRTNFMTRNTFADIDGHNLAIQDGKWSDNSFYALQTGLDHVTKSGTNSITLHTHAYDRDYDDANYDSSTYMLRAQHQTNTWGVGFDYKHDESTSKTQWSDSTGNQHNLGYFFNASYNIFSYHHRFDEEHESYKVGFLQPLTDSLTLRGNHATGYKNRTTWGAEEFSDTQEISLDYNRFTTTFFQSDVGDLNSEGIELSYGVKDFRVFASHLDSRTNDTVNVRRPEWNLGLMHNMELQDDWALTTNYKFKGEHLDIHNSNWSTISMPETHLLDLTVSKNWHGIDLGVTMTNLLDERYESPHGFGQDGRRLQFGFRRSF